MVLGLLWMGPHVGVRRCSPEHSETLVQASRLTYIYSCSWFNLFRSPTQDWMLLSHTRFRQSHQSNHLPKFSSGPINIASFRNLGLAFLDFLSPGIPMNFLLLFFHPDNVRFKIRIPWSLLPFPEKRETSLGQQSLGGCFLTRDGFYRMNYEDKKARRRVFLEMWTWIMWLHREIQPQKDYDGKW